MMHVSTPFVYSLQRWKPARTLWKFSASRPFLNKLLCSYSSNRAYSNQSGSLFASDGRSRLSQIWIPTGGIAASTVEDGQSKLIRAGFLRQAHSGIFQILPLGRRVQEKLETLIDKHMSHLGASKLSLSSISSEELWSKSGRLTNGVSELFHFKDRKDVKYLLSPTHEEEITSLVSSTISSYKELPLRLYQISRKYRDELRPRQGLLRSREFVMKDLYTFDYNTSLALETYYEVRKVYAQLFDELKVPYLMADADSGDMGGNLSHEFHFPTPMGEDDIVSCSNCDYVANSELAECKLQMHQEKDESNLSDSKNDKESTQEEQLRVWRGISHDRQTLINVWYPLSSGSESSGKSSEINLQAIKSLIPSLDTSIEDASPFWQASRPSTTNSIDVPPTRRLINLIDSRVPSSLESRISSRDSLLPFFPQDFNAERSSVNIDIISSALGTDRPLNLLKIRDGDLCNRCTSGTLKVQKAIELGHTFHLGSRYSDPLGATVTVPTSLLNDDPRSLRELDTASSTQVSLQMGCHGIGVSRIIGAVADTLADDRGLNWPRVMAPFEVVVIPANGLGDAATIVYDKLKSSSDTSKEVLDIVLDDRASAFPWKMKDADLVGYPVIVVVGRRWAAERICEVQCRRLGIRQDVAVDDLPPFTASLLSQL